MLGADWMHQVFVTFLITICFPFPRFLEQFLVYRIGPEIFSLLDSVVELLVDFFATNSDLAPFVIPDNENKSTV